MSQYLGNVVTAAVVFPLIAAVCSLPYAIWQYRRFGSISTWKTLMVFGCIFYLLCAYFMVILPLPADRTAVYANALAPQLVPFAFLEDMRAPLAQIDPAVPATWLAFLRNPAVYTTLFNVVLTMPLGVFAGYFYECRWWQAWLAGLALALFFEISQVTGLFGLYAHPYRLFDVDDLITNSTGALLGFWCALPLRRVLPDMDEVEAEAIERGARYTTVSRRLVAFIIDAALTAGICALIELLLPGTFRVRTGATGALMVATGIAFMAVPVITRGQTAGQAALRLRVVRPDGSSAPAWRLAARGALLYWVFLLAPLWIAALFPQVGSFSARLGDEATIGSECVLAVLAGIYGAWGVTVLVRAVRSAGGHPFVMLNGVLTGTRVMAVAQADRLRAARHQEILADELHELDIDPLGTDIDDAFDASFDTTSADEGCDFDPEEQGHI